MFIYALCEPDTESVRYVGATNNIEKRFRQHLKAAAGTHRGNWILNLQSMGMRPSIVVLENAMDEMWQERERYWIGYYWSLGTNLTNGTSGGDGLVNPAPWVREKLSKAFKGRVPSQEARKNMSIARKGRTPWNKGTKGLFSSGMKGKKHTEETKRKISEKGKGRIVSENARKRIGLASIGNKWNVGRVASEETKKKIADANRKRVWTEESRRRASNAHKNIMPWIKGKHHSEETKRKIRETKAINRGNKA